MKKSFIFSVLAAVIVGFVSCGGGDKEKSSEKEITSFKVDDVSYHINDAAKTITYTYPKTGGGTWPTLPTWSVIPDIKFKGASISPKADEPQNFETGVTYTVYAEDGSTQKYTVKADKSPTF